MIKLFFSPINAAVMGRQLLLIWTLGAASLAQEEGGVRAPIPEDLLADDHIREEFGVNELTTPSIGKIFDMMGALGTLNYDELKRAVPDKPPGDRAAASLGLGVLIAEGFLVVQCEKVEAMENVGRSMIKFAKALGAGSRMNRHTQSLLENSVQGDWQSLRVELAKTQSDVESEMVQLRDVEIAHLISLGGWLRGFEISTQAVKAAYTEEKSREIGRRDIVEYYNASLEELHPEMLEQEPIKSLRAGLKELLILLDVPEGKALSPEEVDQLALIATKLMKKL